MPPFRKTACQFDPGRPCAQYTRAELLRLAKRCAVDPLVTLLSSESLCRALTHRYADVQTDHFLFRDFYRNRVPLPGTIDLFSDLEFKLMSSNGEVRHQVAKDMFPMPYNFTFLYDSYTYRDHVDLTVAHIAHVLADNQALANIQRVLTTLMNTRSTQSESPNFDCQLYVRLYIAQSVYGAIPKADRAFFKHYCAQPHISFTNLKTYVRSLRADVEKYTVDV